MEQIVEKKEIFACDPVGRSVSVYVQNPDQYTGLAVIDIVTQCYETATGDALYPRSFKLFLTPENVKALGLAIANYKFD